VARVRAAFYGDDFTGSVDALLQFARRGWTGRLFVGVPSADALSEAAEQHDVVGIAGIARSLPTEQIESEVRPALEALAALGAHVVQYKACSTADSSPAIGSLGRVIELGCEIVSPRTVPVLFAQPDFGRYTAFGHHFAAEDGVVFRLDRQPTMSRHPSTPMSESDLAVHLRRQTTLMIGSIPFTDYRRSTPLATGLRESSDAAVVLDALTEDDLALVGEAVLSLEPPVFAIGSGGLSHGIAAADPGPTYPLPTTAQRAGPVLAVSGSRSVQTRRQVEAARHAGWLVDPLPLRADERADVVADVVAALRSGRSVALHSDDADLPGTSGPEALEAIAASAADVISIALAARGTGRVVVCGGDTSSRVVRLLGVEALSISANPWANVVLLEAHAHDRAIDGVELLLKGGQVGTVDLFERLLALPAGGLRLD